MQNNKGVNMMENIELVKNKKDCCGCEACMNICPKNAITMEKDEFGFTYPKIDNEKCIKCGLCKRTCAYQNEKESSKTIESYASISKDLELLKKSASGGIFASIAMKILEKDGVVYGCSLEREEDRLTPKHIRVDEAKDLAKLQGSKYVQSKTGFIYQDIKKDLKDNKIVLFSGTPCQVAALNSFLGNIDKTNLFTIDIICHGTPSIKFFQDYISVLEKKLKGKITNFSFRDKTEGWGLKGKAYYIDKKNTKKEKIILSHLSSYYRLFLNSSIYRENCYNCKYAGDNRVGDLTIGDYWGIEKEHPDYLKNNGGVIDEKKGVSCILVNTPQGKKLIEKFGEVLEIKQSTFAKVAKQNGQLNYPSKKNKDRKKILEIYKNEGYEGVEKWFFSKLGSKKYLYFIWEKIPRKIQLLIKK